MYLRKAALAILLFNFTGETLLAQSSPKPLNPGLTEISTPSPSAGAISKFGNIPVGPSTGIPSITIPVYTHSGKIKDVDLSVSLDYHAGGVRVDEIASNVGLGWTLNAGGAITRTVRGIPDEIPLYGFFNSPALPQYIDQGNQPASPYERPFNQIYNNQLDSQNDIFSFNFNGRSGKFVFGKNGELLMLSQQKLLITKELANVNGKNVIAKFTVIDEKGVKYEFSDYEITHNLSSGAYNLTGFSSAWYLSKIVSSSGQDAVIFQYESNTIYSYNLSRSFSEVRPLRPGAPPYNYSASFLTQAHDYLRRLKKISFPDGVAVDLTYDVVSRTDYTGDKALKEIVVSDLNGNSRGVKLLHDYSLGRLTLLKVTPFNPVDGLSSPYDLEYLGGLPERFSMQQDHWGFANNNTSNTLIPEEYYSGTLYSGGNRSTSSLSGKAGSLRKISYPTGGYTIFDLEVNDAKDAWLTSSSLFGQPQLYVGGLRVRKISDYDGISPDPVQIREYKYVMEDGITSSGALGTYPEYSNPVYYMFREEVPMTPAYVEYYINSEYNVLIRGSSSIYDLSYINGSPVTYQRVVEQYIDKNNVPNGRIVRNFTSFEGRRPNIPFGFPFTPAYNYEWTYGLLTNEYIYDKNNVLLKETKNEYNYIDDNFYQTPGRFENFRCITIAPVKFIVADVFTPMLGGDPVYFDMNSFSPVAGRSELVKSTVTDYGSAGGSLKKETVFQYDQSNYYLVSETTNDSKGDVLTTQYKYPKEMIAAGRDPSGVYQQMVNKNMIAPLVESVLLKNTVVNKLVRNNYYSFYANVLEPQTTVLKNGGFPETTVARYYAYDIKGNQLSASKENDVRLSYIWDHSRLFAQAIVKNADEQDIAFTSFETDGKGNWNNYTGTVTAVSVSPFPPTGKKYYNLTAANKLSKAVTNGKVYIISYWRNNTTPFTINGGNAVHTAGRTINGWTFHQHKVTATSALLEITGSGAIDEVRLYPEKAQMTTYTYEALHGVTAQSDNNNRITRYEYDAFGRLKLVRDEDNKILKQYDYQYKAPITQ